MHLLIAVKYILHPTLALINLILLIVSAPQLQKNPWKQMWGRNDAWEEGDRPESEMRERPVGASTPGQFPYKPESEVACVIHTLTRVCARRLKPPPPPSRSPSWSRLWSLCCWVSPEGSSLWRNTSVAAGQMFCVSLLLSAWLRASLGPDGSWIVSLAGSWFTGTRCCSNTWRIALLTAWTIRWRRTTVHRTARLSFMKTQMR